MSFASTSTTFMANYMSATLLDSALVVTLGVVSSTCPHPLRNHDNDDSDMQSAISPSFAAIKTQLKTFSSHVEEFVHSSATTFLPSYNLLSPRRSRTKPLSTPIPSLKMRLSSLRISILDNDDINDTDDNENPSKAENLVPASKIPESPQFDDYSPTSTLTSVTATSCSESSISSLPSNTTVEFSKSQVEDTSKTTGLFFNYQETSSTTLSFQHMKNALPLPLIKEEPGSNLASQTRTFPVDTEVQCMDPPEPLISPLSATEQIDSQQGPSFRSAPSSPVESQEENIEEYPQSLCQKNPQIIFEVGSAQFETKNPKETLSSFLAKTGAKDDSSTAAETMSVGSTMTTSTTRQRRSIFGSRVAAKYRLETKTI